MKKYSINNHAEKIVSDITFISGSARSGTSIIGKYIGSLKNYEYYFEPPMLFQLLAEIDNLEPLIARRLLIAYFYEELFAGSISGRSLNYKPTDDSCVFNMMSKEEVNRRVTQEFPKSKLKLCSKKIAFKIPDFVYKEQKLVNLFPNVKIIRMVREPSSTIASLLNKGWFSDENIRTNEYVWPCTKNGDIYEPHFLSAEYQGKWDELSEFDRCIVYYIMQTPPKTYSKNILTIDYKELLNYKTSATVKIRNFLDTAETSLSRKIFESMRVQESTQRLPESWLSNDLYQIALQNYTTYGNSDL